MTRGFAFKPGGRYDDTASHPKVSRDPLIDASLTQELADLEHLSLRRRLPPAVECPGP